MRKIGRWSSNWRNLLGIGALIVAATLSGEVVVAEHARTDLGRSLQAQINSEAASNHQAAVDRAHAAAEIAVLEGRVAQLLTEVRALDTQVSDLGARPVVVDIGSGGSGSSPSSTTQPRPATPAPPPSPSPTTTTTTRPKNHPQPPPKCGGVSVLGVCVG